MKFLFVLTLYQVVSARFQWLDSRTSLQNPDQQRQNFDDLFTGLLNDMQLDISFDAPQEQSTNTNDNFEINNNDISDMLSLFTSPNNNFAPQRSSKPIFLFIESSNPQPQRQDKPAVFTLQQTNKVSGNTWRYSVTTHGNNQMITESWSTPKMFLCNKAQCGEQSGIEMTDIFNNFGNGGNGQKYMHLMPITTAQTEIQPMIEEYMSDSDSDIDIDSESWMDYARDTVKGCHGKMQQMTGYYTYYFGDTDTEGRYYGYDEPMNGGNEIELVQYNDEYKSDAIFTMGMAAIMVLIIFCGIMYATWKYMLERKARDFTTEGYIAMEETDHY